MEKNTKIVTKVCETENGKCVDVFAYVTNKANEEVTLGYELNGKDEMFLMCYGWISTEDPGDAPSKEYKSREEAMGSEYAGTFEEMIDAASKKLAV